MTNAPGTSFGVIVAGSDNDLCLTLGAIESVRHFMPDVPIALVFDGRHPRKMSHDSVLARWAS